MAKLIIGVLLLFFLTLVILFVCHRHVYHCSLALFKKGEERGGYEIRGRRDIERRVL
jgi:hypothetical protein